MIHPFFWLFLSVVLLVISFGILLMAALPTLRELSRAARSAEKLFDTLSREFPATLDALRTTGLEISELTDELNHGVKQASHLVKQADQGLQHAQRQSRYLRRGTQRLSNGLKAAWQTWQRSHRGSRRHSSSSKITSHPPQHNSLLAPQHIRKSSPKTNSLKY